MNPNFLFIKVVVFTQSRCFHSILVLLPVVPDVLDIIVLFQQFDEPGHVLDVLLAGQLDVVQKRELFRTVKELPFAI